MVVEVTLRLVPALPEPLTAVATFADVRHAAATVADLMASGAQPSLLESMDGTTLRMINAYRDVGLDADAGAMLLMQSDGSGSAATARAEVEAFAGFAEGHEAILVSHQLPIVMVQRSVLGLPLAHASRQCDIASVTSLVFEGRDITDIFYTTPSKDI